MVKSGRQLLIQGFICCPIGPFQLRQCHATRNLRGYIGSSCAMTSLDKLQKTLIPLDIETISGERDSCATDPPADSPVAVSHLEFPCVLDIFAI